MFKEQPLASPGSAKNQVLTPAGPECGEGGQGTSQSVNPLLEAVLKARSNQGAHLNHSLSRTFLPPLR